MYRNIVVTRCLWPNRHRYLKNRLPDHYCQNIRYTLIYAIHSIGHSIIRRARGAGGEEAQGSFQKKFSGGRCYKKPAVSNPMNNLPQF